MPFYRKVEPWLTEIFVADHHPTARVTMVVTERSMNVLLDNAPNCPSFFLKNNLPPPAIFMKQNTGFLFRAEFHAKFHSTSSLLTAKRSSPGEGHATYHLTIRPCSRKFFRFGRVCLRSGVPRPCWYLSYGRENGEG